MTLCGRTLRPVMTIFPKFFGVDGVSGNNILTFDFASWGHFLQNDSTNRYSHFNNFMVFSMRFKRGISKYGRATSSSNNFLETRQMLMHEKSGMIPILMEFHQTLQTLSYRQDEY